MKGHVECLNCLYSNKPCEYEDKYYLLHDCPGYHPLITFERAWEFIDGKLVKVSDIECK